MKFDLEERLIRFAEMNLSIAEHYSSRPAVSHLCTQLMRSGTSPALNYCEAQAAESRKDFIHKMKIGLKELRETSVCLKIIQGHVNDTQRTGPVLQENNELIAIFIACIRTASAK